MSANSIALMTPLLPDPLGPENYGRGLLEVDVELPNASHFFNMGGFESNPSKTQVVVSAEQHEGRP